MTLWRRARKGLACLLAVTLAAGLSACSQTADKTETGESAKAAGTTESVGETQEAGVSYDDGTRITPEELSGANAVYTQIFCAEDGTLEVLGYTEDQKKDQTEAFWYRSADGGESWEKQETPSEWEGSSLENVFVDSEGGLYAVFYTASAEDEEDYGQPTGYYLPAEGKAVTSTLPSGLGARFGEHAMLLSVEDKDTENYYLEAVDLQTGKKIFTAMKNSSAYLNVQAVTEEKIYVSDAQKTITVLSAEDGSEITPTEELPEDFGSRVILQTSEESYYYEGTNLDICRGVWGADAGEVILEGSGSRWALEAGDISSVTALAVDGEDSIYLAVEGDTSALWKFCVGSADTAADSQTITIWALEDSETLREAVLVFEDSHSGWKVNLEIQLTDMDKEGNAVTSGGKTEEDVIKTLNAELLAGAGPDVLILDGLDVENYREQGVLADLADVAQETETVGQVVSAVNGDGSTLVIPARFTVPILMTGGTEAQALPATLEDLTSKVLAHDPKSEAAYMEGADQNEEDDYYLTDEIEVFYTNLLAASAPALIRDQAVQEDAVRSWLTALKTVADYYQWFSESSGNSSFLNGISLSGYDYYDYGNRNVEWENDIIAGEDMAASLELEAFQEIPGMLQYEAMEDNTITYFTMEHFPGIASGTYTPKLLMAVSAGSSVQDAAKDFVRAALSSAVQDYTYGDGLSVLKSSADAQIEYFKEDASGFGWDISELTTLFDSLTTPVILESRTEEVLESTASAYCLGSTTLDQAVENLKEELALALAEQ